MSQDKSDYEKKIAQANAARQRQLEKQKAKLASPEHYKTQQEKQAGDSKMWSGIGGAIGGIGKMFGIG